MIKINDWNYQKTIRVFPDIFEPFVVKQLRKKYRTFFVYRCSDYQTIHHLAKSQKWNLTKISHLIHLIEKYWNSIDIIHIKCHNMPENLKNDDYFSRLRQMELTEKSAKDIDFFETKVIGNAKNTLSINTYKFSKELNNINKKLCFIPIAIKGDISLSFDIEQLQPRDFRIRTHYGSRK